MAERKESSDAGERDDSAHEREDTERSPEERERIEREMHEQAKRAQDEPVEGYESEVADEPDAFEPEKKRNVHAATIRLGFGIFLVLVAVIVAFMLL